MASSSQLFAHSVAGDVGRARWEKLSDHLRDVGHAAARHAGPFGYGKLALAAGLLHDIGKCSAAYQRYIATPGANRGPDHSTAGAREAGILYGAKLGRIIGYAIAGHHAGLMDGTGEAGKGNPLDRRLDPAAYPIEPYPGWREQVSDLPSPDDLRRLPPPPLDPQHTGFGMAFLIRMIFSCLVDADFLETERFYAAADGLPAPARGGSLDGSQLMRVRRFMEARPAADSALNRLRAEILDHAVAKAALAPGFFTLTVPTGGGKTLTSLRFGLEHAALYGLRRLIYVIPYTDAWIETASSGPCSPGKRCRVPHGRVDRNTADEQQNWSNMVASRTDAWIETGRD